MAAPTVVTTNPPNGEAGVYKNKVLSVTFSEALLASTVNTTNFTLRNLDAAERVAIDVTLSADQTTVSILPTRYLLENTAYKLYIVGASTAVGTPIQDAATQTDMATTVTVSFSTGTEIEVTNIEKSEDVQAREGQIDLPSNLIVVAPTSYLEITGSNPQNKEFGVSPDLEQIVLSFGKKVHGVIVDENLDTSTVTEATVTVEMGPYYEEDEDMLALPTVEDGKFNFQWEEITTSQYRVIDYTDVTGTLSATQNLVVWTADTTRDFPNNSKVTVTIKRGLKGVSGVGLDADYRIDFYVKTAPETVSIERVRDEFLPYSLTEWTDDMIGKTIYKNTIDALACVRWKVRSDKVNHFLKKYVLYSTVVDIFEVLRQEEELLAGQFKKLGDLVIRYDVRIPDFIPTKMREAMKQAEDLKDMLTARFRDTPLSVIKGASNATQRTYLRTRLWHSDMLYSLEGWSSGRQNAGNTRDIRATKLPGLADPW